MVKLVDPTAAVHSSFLAALEEFRPEKQWPYSTLDAAALKNPAVFDAYVQSAYSDRLADAVGREGYVPAVHLWFIEEEEFLGRLSVRLKATEEVEFEHGHIGYNVRPSARRQGFATEMLKQALPVARWYGLASVRITCDANNIASQRVIKSNGGRPETHRDGMLAYRIYLAGELSIPTKML
ncbi:MAG: GNAT family N-acetyltransferase [Candidatus Dormibacteraceae bacterium]